MHSKLKLVSIKNCIISCSKLYFKGWGTELTPEVPHETEVWGSSSRFLTPLFETYPRGKSFYQFSFPFSMSYFDGVTLPY